MLVLKRKIGEVLRIGPAVSVRVLEVRRGEVRLGFVAPGEVRIYREEIFRAIENFNQQARLPVGKNLARSARVGVRFEEDTVVTSADETVPARSAEQAQAEFVQVRSRRFGSFDVPRDRMLEFAHGLVGFPNDHRYVILDYNQESPFKWMISLDDSELAFVIADPHELVPAQVPLLEAAARQRGADPNAVALFVIVTVADPSRATVNLMAPVAVDLRTRTARQLVLEGTRLPLSHPLTAGSAHHRALQADSP